MKVGSLCDVLDRVRADTGITVAMGDQDYYRADQFEQDKIHNYNGHQAVQQWPECFSNLWQQTPEPRRHSSTSSSTSQYHQAMDHGQKLIEQYQPPTQMPIAVSSSMLPLEHSKPLVNSHSGLMINMSRIEPMHENGEQVFGLATPEQTYSIPSSDVGLPRQSMVFSSQTLPFRPSAYAVSYVDEQERAEELQQQHQLQEEQHDQHKDPALTYEYVQNVDNRTQPTSRNISRPISPAPSLHRSNSTSSSTPPPPFTPGPTDLIDTIPGQSLLHIAASKGHRKILELLLQRGGIAVLNSRDADGFTSLQRAVCSGHMEIVQLLLDHGADIATLV
jgi:Ankyrin repeats (3 copies)